MPFTDYGLVQLGSFIKGDSPTPPEYMEFGGVGSVFAGTQSHLGSGFFRNPVTWRWVGARVKGTTNLLTTDGVGSNIQEIGLGQLSVVGSDLYTRDLSAIGDKTSLFTVDVSVEMRFSRPPQ